MLVDHAFQLTTFIPKIFKILEIASYQEEIYNAFRFTLLPKYIILLGAKWI